MSNATQQVDTYAQYILNTGVKCAFDEWMMGRYLYQSRFQGLNPICDIGPGRCWFLRQAPDRISGVDNSPDLVRHHVENGLDVHLGDAYAIPFPDNHFEGVFCCWLFEHLAEPARAMVEIRRVLRPGGYACIIVPSEKSLLGGFYDDYTHIRPFTRKACHSLAVAAGFRRIRSEYLYKIGGWAQYVRLSRVLGEWFYMASARFMDRRLRKIGIVNRNNVVLEVWKD